MNNKYSLIACWLIFLCLFICRTNYSSIIKEQPLKITTWDAFGYYMYLPSILIYDDYKQLNWLDSIDKKYEVTGGNGWQAHKEDNGNYVFKYLGGIALLEIPWFFIGHCCAHIFHYPQDGFSAPYQYTLGFGVIVYCFLGLLVLRKTLLKFFNETTVSMTLIGLCLGTNFIQYASIDNAQSHVYIFPLYAFIVYATIKWHEQPKLIWAALIGLVIGIATICRPTEAIMLFIPLLWQTNNKTTAKQKWQLVRQHKNHVFITVLFGLIGIAPQLIYWKLSSGHFIYDVGSKWIFLNPYFRVLFGPEKGWFFYTPITLFFVMGLFLVKKFSFKNSFIWFCILNIWIVIAWSDWRYGGSYSTRALVQSYPIFAFPFAAFIEKNNNTKWKWLLSVLISYFIVVNLFQINQYNRNILHFNDMNAAYYKHIYLNPNPACEIYSLLDQTDYLRSEKNYTANSILKNYTAISLRLKGGELHELFNRNLTFTKPESWIHFKYKIEAPNFLWNNYLSYTLSCPHQSKAANLRLFTPESSNHLDNNYGAYIAIPECCKNFNFSISLKSENHFEGKIKSQSVRILVKNSTS